MASNFRIQCQRDRDLLYVRLLGDFDEASAYALIDTLKEKCHDASVIFIKAKGVTSLDASGCDAFKKKIHVLKDWCYRLVFMDQNAARLKPEWIELF
jgi:anti-anti-sigma regulatory factor